jgi:hypothetical protein
MADIENSYLTAVWTVVSPEFGADAGKQALVGRALYGLDPVDAVYRNNSDECMKHLGWTTFLADRDFWMKAETDPEAKARYWE